MRAYDNALQVVCCRRDAGDWLVRAGEMDPESSRCTERNVTWAITQPAVLNLANERFICWLALRVVIYEREVDDRYRYVCGIRRWGGYKWRQQLERREDVKRVRLDGVGNRLGWVCKARLEFVWVIGRRNNIFRREGHRGLGGG